MEEPRVGSDLSAEQKRQQEFQKKLRELLGRLDEYLATMNRLEIILVAYPFKNQRIAKLLLQCQEHKQKLNKAREFFQMIASHIANKVPSLAEDAVTQLPAEYVRMLPTESNSFPYEIEQFIEQEKPELQRLEGTTQEFSTVVDRIQQKILEAQKQFSDITQGDFKDVIATLQESLDKLGNEVVAQMQNPAVVGEVPARHYADGLAKFKQVANGLMRSLTAPNLIQTESADKEGWKRPLYGDFQNMVGVLQGLKEHRDVLRLGEQAMGMISEIDIIENQLRSLQLRDTDIPNSLE